ncbi:hypothetical protein E3N88_40374 [Mikania micrantha]|uniref:Uncharacterized protein n=1 Tax=Mikania micrantha TaxID=192012 RepID=A0A5N6LMI8_9ASTR|nr:hypothetical protein E3N88_40374 [Mikania micrantha]
MGLLGLWEADFNKYWAHGIVEKRRRRWDHIAQTTVSKFSICKKNQSVENGEAETATRREQEIEIEIEIDMLDASILTLPVGSIFFYIFGRHAKASVPSASHHPRLLTRFDYLLTHSPHAAAGLPSSGGAERLNTDSRGC